MNLMSLRKLYFAISLFFLIPGMISLLLFGLKPAIDFTGGSLLEIKLIELADHQVDQEDPPLIDKEALKQSLAAIYEIGSIQESGKNQYIIRGKDINNETKNQVVKIINDQYGAVEELRFETVGPTLGRELLIKTLIAIIIVSIMITLYVWRQFNELKYGVCATLAMFHDSLILIGCFSLLGHFFEVEVDVLFVTAVLTTLSFSVHDTIVVFDRIRELRKKHFRLDFQTITNIAVLETLGRSINNSMTIIMMLLALVLLGGETIRWFAVALLIGSITGTYSSTFTATPLLLVWEEIKNRKK